MAHTLKDRIRVQRVAARRALPTDVRRAETRMISSHVTTAVTGGDTVAAYVPVRWEPGFPNLADVLLDVCGAVLLPVARTAGDGTPLPLQWGRYRRGELVGGAFGLLEPSGPLLPPSALGFVRTVFVPSLAVDRHGVRLGRGAGFYDRTLRFCDSAARLVAVVRDDELVDDLPAEPHDVPMTHALTPARGLVALS